jgi:hypothetical protein
MIKNNKQTKSRQTKPLIKPGIQENFVHVIKTICENLTSNAMHIAKKQINKETKT